MSEIMTWESLSDRERDYLLDISDRGGLTRFTNATMSQLWHKGFIKRGDETDYNLYKWTITEAGRALIPATPTPTDELAALQAENKRLRDALAWYADRDNYSHSEVWRHPVDEQEFYIQVVSLGVHLRARKALEGGE